MPTDGCFVGMIFIYVVPDVIIFYDNCRCSARLTVRYCLEDKNSL